MTAGKLTDRLHFVLFCEVELAYHSFIFLFVGEASKGYESVVQIAVFKGDFFIAMHLHFFNQASEFLFHCDEMTEHFAHLVNHQLVFIVKGGLTKISNLGASTLYHLQSVFTCAFFKVNLPHNSLKEGGFTAAVSSNDGYFLTVIYFKIDVFQHHISVIGNRAVYDFVLHTTPKFYLSSKIHL